MPEYKPRVFEETFIPPTDPVDAQWDPYDQYALERDLYDNFGKILNVRLPDMSDAISNSQVLIDTLDFARKAQSDATASFELAAAANDASEFANTTANTALLNSTTAQSTADKAIPKSDTQWTEAAIVGDHVEVTIHSQWGIGADGLPYFQDSGADNGEASFLVPNADGSLSLIKPTGVLPS